MPNEKTETLRRCELFADLGVPELERVARIARTKKAAKGEIIFFQDQPSEAFFIVQAGAVKIHRISAKGKEQILHAFGPGEVFAEVAALDGHPYPATATATEDAVILRLDILDFKRLLARTPEVSAAIIATLCKRLRGLSRLAADLTLKEVDARFVQYLLDLAQSRSLDTSRPFCVSLPTTKADLAAHLGTAGETLSRTLAKLSKAGLIRVSGETIEALQPGALQNLAEPV